MKSLLFSAFFLAAGLVAAPIASAQPQNADPLIGLWETEGGSILDIFTCGDAICANLAWLKKSRDAAGELRRNAFDPSKPLCGSQIVAGLRRTDATTWKGGTVYDVEKGRTASVRVRLKGPNRAEARFYKGITLLGITETLTRAQPAQRTC